MKQVDTLIVGFGLAGFAYAEVLYKANKTFHVIDSNAGGSSVIAAGIYNPTLLKRFTMTWMGTEFHQIALPFYQQIEKRLKKQFLYPSTIYKLFSGVSDQNEWLNAADKKTLSFFLEDCIHHHQINGVNSPFGYGKVNHCGRLNTGEIINEYKKSIHAHTTEAEFDFSALRVEGNAIHYGAISAKRVVFCEGYAMKSNPYFKQLPLVGSKGQILFIKSPELKSEVILKGPIFIAPLGNDIYWAGATFEQNDKSLRCTDESRIWLEERIKKMITVPYRIVDQMTHIRPTVKDRRLLIGTHPRFPNIHILNGLGSRGVLAAPQSADWLISSIAYGKSIPKDVNINRFEKTT